MLLFVHGSISEHRSGFHHLPFLRNERFSLNGWLRSPKTLIYTCIYHGFRLCGRVASKLWMTNHNCIFPFAGTSDRDWQPAITGNTFLPKCSSNEEKHSRLRTTLSVHRTDVRYRRPKSSSCALTVPRPYMTDSAVKVWLFCRRDPLVPGDTGNSCAKHVYCTIFMRGVVSFNMQPHQI